MPIRSADGAGGSRRFGKKSFALEMREAACGAGGRGAADLSLCVMEVMRGGAGSRGQGVDGFVVEAFFHEVWQG